MGMISIFDSTRRRRNSPHGIRRGALSPVRSSKTPWRIAEVNRKLNCFCFVFPEESLALARQWRPRPKPEIPRAAAYGVPFAIKDLTPTKGKRTTPRLLRL